jgi:hypothetical protein
MHEILARPAVETEATGALKTYEKPVFVRRERLSAVTADVGPSVMVPAP